MVRLKEKFDKEVMPKMIEKFGYKSSMAVPRIQKVVVNIGFGRLVTGVTTKEREKIINEISDNLALITGQKPVVTKAKKSIAGFKIRKGMAIGAKVTLRRQMMYDFLDRLIHIALPRTRDFRGLDVSSIDNKGNLNIGVKEHIVFPEVSSESAKKIFSLEITIITNAKTREEALELYRLLKFPIKQ